MTPYKEYSQEAKLFFLSRSVVELPAQLGPSGSEMSSKLPKQNFFGEQHCKTQCFQIYGVFLPYYALSKELL